jgi:endogenous inhibitor of DNA gyrase (YacG/DUF329 family)
MNSKNKPNKKIIVLCPNCQTEVSWTEEQLFKPFCCERCKLIDLGEWAYEEKRIPGDPVYSESDFTSDSDSFLH